MKKIGSGGRLVRPGKQSEPQANQRGTVFEISPASGGWAFTTPYNFNGKTDGNYPDASVIFDSLGNLYGTTVTGGADNLGTVFELSPPSSK